MSFPEIEPIQSYEFGNHNDTSNAVKVNGKILYPEGLRSCIRIHKLIELKCRVDLEITWLNVRTITTFHQVVKMWIRENLICSKKHY